MKTITVFQDDNANYTFIMGTSDPFKAEKELRKQENTWYGVEKERTSEFEKPLDFNTFYPVTLYSRGEFVHWDKEALPKGRGKIAERDGFMAPID